MSSPIPKRQKSQSQDSTLSSSKFHHRPSICHGLNFWYTSSAYQPLVVPFTVAVKQGIGGISSNPPDPQSEATNTITRSWEPQSWQRRETSAQEHLVSGLRDQIPGFHQITFHLQRIHQTRSFWTLINNLTKHYHLNANQTILRFRVTSELWFPIKRFLGVQRPLAPMQTFELLKTGRGCDNNRSKVQGCFTGPRQQSDHLFNYFSLKPRKKDLGLKVHCFKTVQGKEQVMVGL